MSAGSLMKRVVGVFVCVVLCLVTGQSVLAAEFHEDPAAARPVYSGVALLYETRDEQLAVAALHLLLHDDASVLVRDGRLPDRGVVPVAVGVDPVAEVQVGAVVFDDVVLDDRSVNVVGFDTV